MELFGTPIENIYLFVLIIAGILTILYLFFGDFIEVFGEISPFLNPALILAFITFFSAAAYILELVTSLSSIVIIIISSILAFILAAVLNIFVFIPMKSAEESLSYTEDSLKGRVGKIILSVPEDGFGEIVIKSKSGTISKPAASYDNELIQEGTRVLVIEVKNGVLYVVPYETGFDLESG
ncbi:NfeD family protein [Oceanobacillus luteolus]|uniref:NfeD family protein n=1 Tax=Oceanobacillus luteolus TaxID=1274358 RepID=A0ABW4HNA5_9BACI|nr:NfeD family protein [Oceanobacillus luteolus]MCM3739832.1 NfeD family protein [Oceanobacillus luteolus]